MKKYLSLFIAGIVLFGTSGCGSSDSSYEDNLVTLFLVDENGFSYGGVPYICDSMRDWELTPPNGEFTFLPPDECVFDFYGLGGVYGDRFDDIVRIVDYTNDGKGDIPYECASFGVGSTFFDGSFIYDENDECVFYL